MPLDLEKIFKKFVFPLDLDLQVEIVLFIWIDMLMSDTCAIVSFPCFVKRDTHTHTLSESTTIAICPHTNHFAQSF